MSYTLKVPVTLLGYDLLAEAAYDYTKEIPQITAAYPEDSEQGMPEAFVVHTLMLINNDGSKASISHVMENDVILNNQVLTYLQEHHTPTFLDYDPSN
jgi:hypothetical protein